MAIFVQFSIYVVTDGNVKPSVKMTRPRIVPPRLTRKEKMRLWPIELFLHSPQLSKFNLGFLKVRPGTESEECQMVECNLVKLVRKQKTIIIYIEFHIAEPTRPVRWEMAAGWRQSREEELLWDLTIESFAALFVILTVQYSTVQYSTVLSGLHCGSDSSQQRI